MPLTNDMLLDWATELDTVRLPALNAEITAASNDAFQARDDALRAIADIYQTGLDGHTYTDRRIQQLREELQGFARGIGRDVESGIIGTVTDGVHSEVAAAVAAAQAAAARADQVAQDLGFNLDDVRSVAGQILDVELPSQREEIENAALRSINTKGELDLLLDGFDHPTLGAGLDLIRADYEDAIRPLRSPELRLPASNWTHQADSGDFRNKMPPPESWFIEDDPDLGECLVLPAGERLAISPSYHVAFDPEAVYRIQARVKITQLSADDTADVSLGASTWVNANDVAEISRSFIAHTGGMVGEIVVVSCYATANAQIAGETKSPILFLDGSAEASRAFFFLAQSADGSQLRLDTLDVRDVTEAFIAMERESVNIEEVTAASEAAQLAAGGANEAREAAEAHANKALEESEAARLAAGGALEHRTASEEARLAAESASSEASIARDDAVFAQESAEGAASAAASSAVLTAAAALTPRMVLPSQPVAGLDMFAPTANAYNVFPIHGMTYGTDEHGPYVSRIYAGGNQAINMVPALRILEGSVFRITIKYLSTGETRAGLWAQYFDEAGGFINNFGQGVAEVLPPNTVNTITMTVGAVPGGLVDIGLLNNNGLYEPGNLVRFGLRPGLSVPTAELRIYEYMIEDMSGPNASFISASAAAASATAAGEEASAAESARLEVNTALSGAQSARDAAIVAKDDAEGSQAAAKGSADMAASSRNEASGFADAASESATLAGTKATEAETSAVASEESSLAAAASSRDADTARGAAVEAQAAAGVARDAAVVARQNAERAESNATDSAKLSADASLEADGAAKAAAEHATAAASSVTDAEREASAAESSRLVAEAGAARVLPSDMSQEGRFWRHNSNGAPMSDGFLAGGTLPVETAEDGAYLRFPVGVTGNQHVLSEGLVRLSAGRTYRLTVTARAVAGPTNRLRALVSILDGQYQFVTFHQPTPSGFVLDRPDQWQEVTCDYKVASPLPENRVWMRLGVFFNTGVTPDYAVDLKSVLIEDVTAQIEADYSRAQAEIARDDAIVAKEDAEGASAAAAASQELAASSRADAQKAADDAADSQTAAKNSADASSRSAGTAGTHADTASSKADAAETARLAAVAARGGAETAQSQAEQARSAAVSARQDAEGAASNASDQRAAAVAAKGGADAAAALAVSNRNDAIAAKSSAEDASAAATTASQLAVSIASRGTGALRDMLCPPEWRDWTNGPLRWNNTLYPTGSRFVWSGLSAATDAGVQIYSDSPAWVGPINARAYRVDIQFILNAGSANGAGVLFDFEIGSTEYRVQASFNEMVSGPIVPNRVTLASFEFRCPDTVNLAAIDKLQVYVMANYGGFGSTSPKAAKTISIESIQVYPMTATEAAVHQQSTAIADLKGNAQAGFLIKAQAGGQVSLLSLIAADGSNTAASVARIAANQILLDGSVRVEQLTTSMGRNLMNDPLFLEGFDQYGGQRDNTGTFSIRDPGSTWAAANLPTAEIRQIGTGGSYSDIYTTPRINSGGAKGNISITGSAYYMLSVHASMHRANARLGIQFMGPNGGALWTPFSEEFDNGSQAENDPESWTRITFKARAPANAVSARLYFRKTPTKSGASDSYLFLFKPQFEMCHAEATEPAPWDAGGATYMSGGRLVTNSIESRHISVQNLSAISATIGVLRTATSGARQEIHSDRYLVYDANNNVRVHMGNLN